MILPERNQKLLKYLTIFALFLALNSCLGYWEVEVIVENTTGHNIRLEAYYTEVVYTGLITEGEHAGTYEGYYEEVRSEVIYINPHESFRQAQDYHPEDSRSYYLFEEYPIDSVYIIFNNERRIVQCGTEQLLCENPERSILDIHLNYEREDLDRKEYRLTYRITEKDYENALPYGND